MPMHGAYAIVSGGEDHTVPYARSHHVGLLGALAAWRVTQGIYRYDPALYEALVSTPIAGDLPVEPLYRLPQWCVYIETPDMVWTLAGEHRPLHGVWASLDWAEGRPDDLRLVLDTARTPADALDPWHGCIPMPLILGAGGIAAAIERVIANGIEEARKHGLVVPADQADARPVASMLAPIVSLVLYLCADEPDLSGLPDNPRPKRTKGGWRLFPADRLTTWDVGVRIGAALRRAYQQAEIEQQEMLESGRARPRAHVRRAHWHTFLAGAGRLERRVRWLPPIAVNISDEPLPAVIRSVDPT